MFLKILKFYLRWKGNRISTSKQRQLINVKLTSKFNVEQRWFWVDHKIIFFFMFPEYDQRRGPFLVSCRFMKTFTSVSFSAIAKADFCNNVLLKIFSLVEPCFIEIRVFLPVTFQKELKLDLYVSPEQILFRGVLKSFDYFL